MGAQIAIVYFYSPRETSPAAVEKGGANFDGLNFIGWDDDVMKEEPRLEFNPVAIDAVLLPEISGSAF